jgi:DeoR family transcriptional regulator of aga operon
MGGRILEHIHADTAFLSCSGVHPETGVTNINIPEAEMKIRMLRGTSRHIVLADSTKLGRTDLAPVCSLSEVHQLITGEGADAPTLASLRERGLVVEVAGLTDRR